MPTARLTWTAGGLLGVLHRVSGRSAVARQPSRSSVLLTGARRHAAGREPASTHVEHAARPERRHARLAGLGARRVRARVRPRAASTEPWRTRSQAADAGARRPARGARHRHGVGEVAGLPATRADRADRRPRATALYLSPDQGAGRGPAAGARRAGPPAACAAAPPTTATRRSPSGTGCAPRAWVFDEPGHAAPRAPAAARGVGDASCAALRYVVVDECHAYRGVFGSHVALLLRRLRRVARATGRDPVFVLASATVSDPAVSASAAHRRAVAAVTRDGSPRGARTVALWEPPLLDGADRRERRAGAAVGGGGDGADAGRPGGGGRPDAGLRALAARRRADRARRPPACSPKSTPELAARVAAYRAGYLPEERRALERGAATGSSCWGWRRRTRSSWAWTSPGWTPWWWRASRARWRRSGSRPGGPGGSGDGALVVFVARDDPLDTYLVHHPEAMLGAPVEALRDRPRQPVRAGAAAGVRGGRAAADAGRRGVCSAATPAAAVLDDLVRRGPAAPPAAAAGSGRTPATARTPVGRHPGQRRRAGRRSSRPTPAACSARSTPARAPRDRAPGRGVPAPGRDATWWTSWTWTTGLALVHAEDPEWTTARPRGHRHHVSRRREHCARTATSGSVRRPGRGDRAGGRLPAEAAVRARCSTDRRWTCPRSSLRTRAVWYTLPRTRSCGAGLDPSRGPGRAARGRARGDRPAAAVRDLRPLGHRRRVDRPAPRHRRADGVRPRRPPRRRGLRRPRPRGAAGRGSPATRDAIADCECPSGCPSCVQSPKCGNGNDPLDKAGAVVVLDVVLTRLAEG